jgi:hypothetical protein
MKNSAKAAARAAKRLTDKADKLAAERNEAGATSEKAWSDYIKARNSYITGGRDEGHEKDAAWEVFVTADNDHAKITEKSKAADAKAKAAQAVADKIAVPENAQ